MSKTSGPKRPKRNIALVTGATSGIGRVLVEQLLKSKYEVRVILRKQPKDNVEWKDLPSGVKVYVVDLGNTDDASRGTMLEACSGISVLYHLAAVTRNYPRRYGEKTDTNLMINTNVIGTENMLQAYSDANQKGDLRIIYASSVSVYGTKRPGEILTEESEPRPHNSYSESKYMAEQVIKAFASANKRLTYTIFRIGVVYGRGYERSFRQIFKLIKERKLRLVGSGDNHLTLIDTDDVIRGMLLPLSMAKSKNRIFNLTDGVPYTQRELFRKAAKFLNAEPPSKRIHPLIARIGARSRGITEDEFSFLVSDRVISIEGIKKAFGFKPMISIDVSGKRLATEFLKNYKKTM